MEQKEDKLSLQRIQLLHPLLRQEALAMYQQINLALTGRCSCRLTQTFRTYAEQDLLYEIGRTRKPEQRPVTNARGGESYHNFGLAFDICLMVHTDNKVVPRWQTHIDFDNDALPDWLEVVSIAKRFGWAWGGDWKKPDYPHFEKTFGYSVGELHELVQLQRTCYGKFYPSINGL